MTIEQEVCQLQANATVSRQRRLLVISGSEYWCCEQAKKALAVLVPEMLLWVGGYDNTVGLFEGICRPKVIASSEASQWLGKETGCLVINSWSGFCVDAFGILSGTVKAGGVLLLLTPPLKSWAAYQDPEYKRITVYPNKFEDVTGRYLRRMVRLIGDSADLSLLEEAGRQRFQKNRDIYSKMYCDQIGCFSEEQSQTVQAILRVAKGHRKRPLVVTANRGCGKSAALGIAAALLIADGTDRIIVTAPSMGVTDVIFRHAAERLDGSDVAKGVIDCQGRQLIFKAPDELAETHYTGSLLLVDEAAAIPASLLKKLLISYSRIVFSTTIHGYEGSGRSFSIRFSMTLDDLRPQWKKLQIHEPVRWSRNDPLERFSFTSLMLNASLVIEKDLQIEDWKNECFEEINRDELVDNELLLEELFGLLVMAHYKTSPLDLRHLLDGTNISIYVLRIEGHVLAVALVACEGQIQSELAKDIWLGKRRVRGHLLPQILSNHLGIEEAVTLTGGRVIRIAVRPEFQRRGLGVRIMNAISNALSKKGYDYVGSLFGGTSELLDFWGKAGLVPVRIGVTREVSSGTYSAAVLQGLSSQGVSLLNEARRRFSPQFVYLLPDVLNCLNADIVVGLLRNLPLWEYSLSVYDRVDLESFTEGGRLYESCIVSIKKLTVVSLSKNSCLCQFAEWQIVFLVGKVLQHQSWATMTERCKFSGKKQAVSHLRSVVKRLLYLYCK
ncbi:MAG: GNAT family N-acetyltransferase [Candidatus Endonucleobacter bathymodioli]|uniref:tRNA(Met) cytidine acetyltransferase TmcA n=1 Tax=Candidatus Endonucleibacter bathymodioli TaxID=539814 RepID=A0AA90NSK3_9GAMM|nr:GNAT family N-acetyltransferase [Candidatus Endonucleobacter bathymodioli]